MKDNFIMVFKSCLKKGDYLFTPQQLFIYSFCYRNRIINKETWIAKISVNHILSEINCNIDGSKPAAKRKTIIRDLSVLKQKGFLIFEHVDEKIKVNEVLSISFPTYEEEGQFIQIGFELFDSFRDKYKYWLYCFCDVYTFIEQGRKVSYSEISDLMNISDKKVRDLVKEMNTKDANPRIYKFSGSYLDGCARQEENTYYTTLNAEQLESFNKLYDEFGKPKFKRKNKKLRPGDTISTSFNGDVTVSEFKELIQVSNWGTKNIYGQWGTITADDYEIYRISVDYNIDDSFNKRISKAIESMKQYPEMYPYDWEELEEKYLNGELHLYANEKIRSFDNFDDIEPISDFVWD